MNEKYICVICQEPSYGFGNNPWPVVEDEDGRCCDVCNSTKVVPARLAQVMQRED